MVLRDEPTNSFNPRAILIDVATDRPIGWIPDWLVEDVHDLRDSVRSIELVVERANRSAPSHLKVLCRLTTSANRD